MSRLSALRTLLLVLVLGGITSCNSNESDSSSDFPEVFLNHLYRVVDSVTYEAIANCEFIQNEFAIVESRTTVGSNGRSWSGLYLYGDQHYIEFFDERARRITTTGLAFGVEKPEGISLVSKGLSEKFGKEVSTILQDRRIDESMVPWFWYTGIAADYDGKTDLISWVMEYHPDFLGGWHAELSGLRNDIRRTSLLDRYKAKVAGRDYQSGYFKSVQSIHLGLAKDMLDRLLKELQAYHYEQMQTNAGFTVVGPDITFYLTEVAASDAGIQSITFSLNKEKEGKKEFTFGPSSRLVFQGDRTAVWSF